MEITKPDLMIYHHPCPDGWAAAWLAGCHWGTRLRRHGQNHGNAWPDATGLRVLVVDITPDDPIILERMTATAAHLVILDHHATAHHRHGRHRAIVYDAHAGGAEMLWQRLHPGRPLPDWLDALSRRDRGCPLTEAEDAMLVALDDEPREDGAWTAWERRWRDHPSRVLARGRSRRRRLDIHADAVLDGATPCQESGQWGVMVKSTPDMATRLASRWAVHPQARRHPHAGFLKTVTPDGTGVRLTFRPLSDAVGVRLMAERRGGGGHEHASGAWVEQGGAGSADPAAPG